MDGPDFCASWLAVAAGPAQPVRQRRELGRDAQVDLGEFPLASVECIHLSGGIWITSESGEPRLLDDHVHSPPAEVVSICCAPCGRAPPQPLDVILSATATTRSFDVLLAELEAAREALGSFTTPTRMDLRRHA